jgi:formylglycine-generating enzyme required for sulfatase activity
MTNDQVKTFYQEAQASSGTSPLQPLIFKSVSEIPNTKVISEFWIQTETIEGKLYEKIIPSGSVDKVSYNDAKKVIDALNKTCPGYQFELPTEEQFVYLARKVYNPVRDKALKTCRVLKDKVRDNNIKQLLGNKWQLTQSQCGSWSNDSSDPIKQCNPQSYVKKGGTTDSKDATECMPEYRAESTPDVSEPNTTIRLILKQN